MSPFLLRLKIYCLRISKKLQSSGDDAELSLVLKITEHGVSFPRASLTISKNSGIFAIHKIVNVPGGNFVKEELLRDEFSKNSVKTVTVFAIIDH